MAIQAFKIDEKTHDYVPLMERNESKPFTAVIRQLKPQELAILEDGLARINSDQSMTIQSGSFNYAVLKAGLVDWDNFLDGEKQIKPEKTPSRKLSDASLDLLPPLIVAELSEVILNISRFPTAIDVYLGKEIADGSK